MVRAALVLLSMAIAAMWLATTAGPALAQGDEPTPGPVVIDEVDDPAVGRIIPRPNSGSPPQNPGEPGGALQLTLLGLIIAFMAIAFFSVRRSMKRARASQTPGSPT